MPSFLNINYHQVFVNGDRAVITCAEPRDTYMRWMHYGQHYSRRIIPDNLFGNLVIEMISHNDSGLYICQFYSQKHQFFIRHLLASFNITVSVIERTDQIPIVQSEANEHTDLIPTVQSEVKVDLNETETTATILCSTDEECYGMMLLKVACCTTGLTTSH